MADLLSTPSWWPDANSYLGKPADPDTGSSLAGVSGFACGHLGDCTPQPVFTGGWESFLGGIGGSLVSLIDLVEGAACPSCAAVQSATGHTAGDWYQRQLNARGVPTGPRSEYGAVFAVRCFAWCVHVH